MPAPHSPDTVRVRVAATQAGPYHNIGYVRSVDVTRGREGATTLRYFGGDAVKPGAKTLEAGIPVWWDDEDTDGQEVLRTAYDDDTLVWIEVCPHGTEVGAKTFQFEATVDSDPFNADSEGDAIEGDFTLTGSPSTWTKATIASGG